MKKKLIAMAIAAVALVGTIGITTAYAAANDLADIWAARTEARAGFATNEQREQRAEWRAGWFGNRTDWRTDEQRAEGQAFRSDWLNRFFADGMISPNLFNNAAEAIEYGRDNVVFPSSENWAEAQEFRFNLISQLFTGDALAQELFNDVMDARVNSDRLMRGNGGRGGWFWQQ